MEGFIGLFFHCPVTDRPIIAVAPIGVKFCTMVHIMGPGQISSSLLLGAVPPWSPKSKILAL